MRGCRLAAKQVRPGHEAKKQAVGALPCHLLAADRLFLVEVGALGEKGRGAAGSLRINIPLELSVFSVSRTH